LNGEKPLQQWGGFFACSKRVMDVRLESLLQAVITSACRRQ
jgi:hypothetical protein